MTSEPPERPAAIEGITHSDSRLWRTRYLLWFKPGRLTQEFVAGRRAAYLPPFRLYLILSIIFFLIASVSNTQVKFVRLGDDASGIEAAPPDCASLNSTQIKVTLATAPKAMFIFLPLVAFLHMLMYWRPRHRYAEHLLFFVHVHAFFFSLMTVVILSAEAGRALCSRHAHFLRCTWSYLASPWQACSCTPCCSCKMRQTIPHFRIFP